MINVMQKFIENQVVNSTQTLKILFKMTVPPFKN